jgi:hypothetical protein
MSKPDEVIVHPDGSEEHITYRESRQPYQVLVLEFERSLMLMG